MNENNEVNEMNEVIPELPVNLESPPPTLMIEEEVVEIDKEGQESKRDLERLQYLGLSIETLTAAIETVIFLSEKPMSMAKIRDAIDPTLGLRIVHNAIQTLQKEYELSHHGIRLYEVAEGFQFRTKAFYSKFIKEQVKIAPLQLTPLSVEVLAMVAFKQPITKVEIDRLRGVDSGHLLRGLMDKKLIKTVGKTDDATRSTQYATTQDFLEIFNLNKVEDMPSYTELEELAQANTVGDMQDLKEIIHNNDKNKFVFDEMAELDKLSDSIKSISVHTEFTSLIQQHQQQKKSSEGAEALEAPMAVSDLLEVYMQQKELKEENARAAQSHFPVEQEQALQEEQLVDSVQEEQEEVEQEQSESDFDVLSQELDQAFERMKEKEID